MSRVWRDGAILDDETAGGLPGPGPGIAAGEGVYETLRVEDGRPLDVDAHLERLAAGLHRIGLDIPETRADLERAVASVAAGAPRPLARLRIVVRRAAAGGPASRTVSAVAYDPPSPRDYARGVPVVIDEGLVIDPRALHAGVKVIAREPLLEALRRAEARGAFEALLFNSDGLLVEGSRSNVIVVLEGSATTPPLSDGCLPGTIRRRLLEADALVERSVDRAALAAAGGVLLTSSMMGVVPVGSIDGRPIPVGPEAADLRRLLRWPSE